MMKNSTQRLMTLIFNQGGVSPDYKRVPCLSAPSGLASLAFGHPSGQNQRRKLRKLHSAFPVLMLPSHALRDISCAWKSKTKEHLSAFGHLDFLSGPFGPQPESASLAFSQISTKDEKLKNQKHLSAFGQISSNYDPFGSNSRAPHCVRQNKQKTKVLKGVKAQKHLSTFGYKSSIRVWASIPTSASP